MNNLNLVKNIEMKMFDEILKNSRKDLKKYLKNLDDSIYKDAKKEWKVVRKDERTITTAFGKIKYSRRYYVHRKNGN